jgi:hypothetical protein
VTERTYKNTEAARLRFAEYQRERRKKIRLGLHPGKKPPPDPNPPKPTAELRRSNLTAYMRLYMRWYRAIEARGDNAPRR